MESGPELEHFVADVESAAAVDDAVVVPVVADGVAVADVESAADYVADPAPAAAVDDFAVVVVVVAVVVEASS